MTEAANLIVNTLRECAVATQCSRCVVFCGSEECLFTAAAQQIESLAKELERAMRERDALLRDLRDCHGCYYCINKHCCPAEEAAGEDKDYDYVCSACDGKGCACKACENGSNWEWRGRQNDLSAMKGE